MAALPDAERFAVWQDMMQITPDTTPLLKADLRAAVNALDDFMNTNAATINAALPQPARGALSVQQKARLLTLVVHRRYLQGA